MSLLGSSASVCSTKGWRTLQDGAGFLCLTPSGPSPEAARLACVDLRFIQYDGLLATRGPLPSSMAFRAEQCSNFDRIDTTYPKAQLRYHMWLVCRGIVA
jgi:hypothetical protein